MTPRIVGAFFYLQTATAREKANDSEYTTTRNSVKK